MRRNGKYIIVEIRGTDVPILFDEFIGHDLFGLMFSRRIIQSAGFFIIYLPDYEDDFSGIKVNVFGKSNTLDIQSRLEDSEIIKKFLEG